MAMSTDGGDDELLLVQELPMDMHTDRDDDGGSGSGSEDRRRRRRLAHLLPPLAACSLPLPPYRPPPPPSAAASAEPRVAFRGWLGAPRHWDLWVAKLRPIHEDLWREVGILDAVLASTYGFKRDAAAVLHLASFWSPETSTFAFPWGEATLTLQDVAVLGGFPADGSPAPAPLPPEWRPDEAALDGVRLGFNRSTCKKAHHAAWMKHFLTDTGDADAGVEHAAFLALWLARFALPGQPEATMHQSLFPLAVRLARGERVALGPAVLASLYRDLREMKAYLVAVAATGGNAEFLPSLSVHAPLYILQLWMWERFPTLWDGKAKPIRDGEPRAARWHDVSKKMKSPAVIREVLNSGKNFLWQPYTSYVQAWKQCSGWVRASDVAMNKELRSLAHCLRACELVGVDCIEQYLPHRVAMQFGLDQDVPADVRRANNNWRVAWETYDLEGQSVAFFVPRSKPGVTARYAQWWRQPRPPSDLDVCAANVAMGGKVSKRKVKKTPAAMEAEAEKERKMKKARTTPNDDKKRKLEELYDAKLSDWFAAARNRSSGSAGSSCKRGSSPKSDMGSDKALLDSAESSKDDTVLLVPRTHAIAPAVNLKKDKEINAAIGDIGDFESSIVTEGVGRVAGGTSCSFEAVVGSKQEVDAGVMICPRGDAVALPEEILPVQQPNYVGECIEMSCIMENSDVDAGVLGTDDGQTTCDFVSEGQREVSCVEDTGVGESSQMIEKDSKQNSQENPQVGIAECEEDIILMRKDSEVEHEKVLQTAAEVVTDNNMAAVLLVVPEAEDADMSKALKIAKKDTEDVPTELVEAEGAKQEQINTLAKGGTEEKHKEVAEADHADMADPNMHAQFDIDKHEEAAEVRDEGKRLTVSDTYENPGDRPHVGNSEVQKTSELIENDNGENLSEVSYVAYAEMELLNGLMKEDTDKKFEEASEIRNDGTHGPMAGHTDGKLKEVSAEARAEMQEVKDLVQKDTYKEFEVVSEVGNTGIDGTHAPMREDTDGKLKEGPEVNAQVEQANGFEKDNDRPDSVLQVDPPARDEKMRDDAPIEKDIEDKLNADGKDLLPTMEIYESTEVFQVEKAEGEQCKVLNEKGTEENTKDALGAKQVVGQDKALTARNMHNSIEDTVLAEQVDGQTKMLARVVVEENPEENTRGKEFDEDMVKSSMNSINSEMQCSLTSIQSKEEQPEISVEGMMEKQCVQDVELIHERESSSDGASVKVGGVEGHKTLDMQEEVGMKQMHDRGIICENKETQILEDSHIIYSGLESDLVIMEVDETLSTGGFQNKEISNSDKQQKMEERQDLGPIVESNKTSEFQSDLPEMKANEVESTKGIQNQETLDIQKEHILGKRLECKIADGNGRTLEVINTPGGGLADTIVDPGDVNDANSVEGVQNQEVCSTDEVSEERQHHGVGDVNENKILEETNTFDSDKLKSDANGVGVDGAESSEGTQNWKEEPAVQEKQDEGVVDENTTRILVNIDEPEHVGVRPDGTRKVTHETLPTKRAVYIAGDENTSKSQQEGVLWVDHHKSEKEPAVQEMPDEGMEDEDSERILVDIDAPECDGVTLHGSMKMNHETLCTVQAINMAEGIISSKNQQKGVPLGDHDKLDVGGSESNQTARKESKGSLQPELVHQVEVKEEILENRTELSIGREDDEASEHDQISTEDAIVALSSIDHQGESNNEWAEEPIKIYGKYASYPVNTGCQTTEVRRIHSARSVYLEDIKEAQGRIRAEPSTRAQINNAGYYSGHGVQEPVSVSKVNKVPLHESATICGRDRAPELVTGLPEETSRWRQEQYALNILEDVQNARSAEKTRMEMEIRILKSQIASMQRQMMNLDHVSVTSGSKRH